MAEEKNWKNCCGSPSGAVYGMGVIGAIVYYAMHYTGLSEFLFGIVKAIFWPVFFIYKMLELLKI